MAKRSSVTFTIPGLWLSERKRNVRAGKFQRRIDLPDRAEFKGKVAVFAQRAMRGQAPLEGPLSVVMTFSRPKPPSWPKNPTKGNPWPEWPWKKPDWDNLGKIGGDPLSGIVYQDDAQVCDGRVRKVWGEWGVEITVAEMATTQGE